MECRSLDLRKKYSKLNEEKRRKTGEKTEKWQRKVNSPRVFCVTKFEKLSKNDSFFSLILEKIEQNIKK